MLIDPLLTLMFKLLILGLFSYSAYHKHSDPAQFKNTLANYGVPLFIRSFVALFISVAESVIAVLIFISLFDENIIGMFLATSLIAFYTGLLLFYFATGRSIDCGCSFGDLKTKIGVWHILRNSALLAGSLLAVFPQSERLLFWMDYFTAFVGALMIGLALITTETLIKNNSLNRGAV